MKSLLWIPSENPPVTLPRVWGIEQGRGYVTVQVEIEQDARGDHMRRKIRKRQVRRQQ